MSEWKQKRFWSDVSVTQEDAGYGVRLDGRAVKTPAKAALTVPTRALAQMIAREWDAQVDTVDPTSMPATRMANAAIDKVRVQRAEVADLLVEYGGTDLLCYRADSPQSLADRQAAGWDPALAWASETLGVTLRTGAGVMHILQESQDLERFSKRVHALTEFQLAAFYDLVTISGSLVLAFATAAGWRPAQDIWMLSVLDDLWQQEQWGKDEEAAAQAEHKRNAFVFAAEFFGNC